MDDLERVIRPIVEGQLRSFAKDHPEVIEAVNWYKRRPDKTVTFVNSVAKRIVRDLTCLNTRARLEAALCGTRHCEGSDDAELELGAGPAGGGVEAFYCTVLSLGADA